VVEHDQLRGDGLEDIDQRQAALRLPIPFSRA
jgi:hypothetical protein